MGVLLEILHLIVQITKPKDDKWEWLSINKIIFGFISNFIVINSYFWKSDDDILSIIINQLQ